MDGTCRDDLKRAGVLLLPDFVVGDAEQGSIVQICGGCVLQRTCAVRIIALQLQSFGAVVEPPHESFHLDEKCTRSMHISSREWQIIYYQCWSGVTSFFVRIQMPRFCFNSIISLKGMDLFKILKNKLVT